MESHNICPCVSGLLHLACLQSSCYMLQPVSQLHSFLSFKSLNNSLLYVFTSPLTHQNSLETRFCLVQLTWSERRSHLPISETTRLQCSRSRSTQEIGHPRETPPSHQAVSSGRAGPTCSPDRVPIPTTPHSAPDTTGTS